jgi:pantoate--beta-alanine ligase
MDMRTSVLRSIAELRAWRREQGAKRVGFVPTMGALHRGHAELLKTIRPLCDSSVLSIFVNPTQFGPNEDFAKYPRSLERDLAIALEQGVDMVFLPDAGMMYPSGYSTYVEETSLTKPLCGEFRPGHFRGVTTVVLKLFNLVRPDLALFGLKDAQQFFVLRKMALDLDLDVRVEGMETVREADGLAMSSRNAYLSPEERARAPELQRTLATVAQRLETGASAAPLLAGARERLLAEGFEVQYLELKRLPDLAPAAAAAQGTPYLLAVAAYLGKTRLIDNVILNAPALRSFGITAHAAASSGPALPR